MGSGVGRRGWDFQKFLISWGGGEVFVIINTGVFSIT